jgi:hypothetical protein
LHLGARSEGADQDTFRAGDLRLGGGFDLGAERLVAACFNSWRRTAESMPSFCEISSASSSRTMRLGTR